MVHMLRTLAGRLRATRDSRELRLNKDRSSIRRNVTGRDIYSANENQGVCVCVCVCVCACACVYGW